MTLRDELHEWLSGQELWQQELAKRLVARAQLDDEAYDEALLMVKGAFNAVDEAVAAPGAISLDDVPAAPTGAAPRLTTFGGLRGVGAVADDQRIQFGSSGLTIVYGQNAAGKSTYVRALKRICRTVDCDSDVLGNVFADPAAEPVAPSAAIEYELAGSQRAQRVGLAEPPDLGFDAISVFDSRCAELYLDDENAVAYVPSALKLLVRLASTQDRMRSDLMQEASRFERAGPAFPEVTSPTRVKGLLDALSARTTTQDVEALAQLTEEESKHVADLRAAFASVAADNSRADAGAAESDSSQAHALASGLRDLTERVTEAKMAEIRAQADEVACTQVAVEAAAQEFAGLPVPGVGSETWRRMWEAARLFAEGGGRSFPPTCDDRCPLCLQEVGSTGATQMSQFEDHVKSALGEAARRAQERLDGLLGPLAQQDVDALGTQFLAGLAGREPELFAQASAYLEAIAESMRTAREKPGEAAAATPDPAALTELEAWATTRQSHANTLRAAEDPQRQADMRQELAELEAREHLAMRLDDVKTRISNLKRAAALREAHSALATNRITTKVRELSETVVAGTLETRLQDELRRLRCDHLPVRLRPRTAVGATHVQLRLAGARGAPAVSDIASEGEQRALALSFFLAEVSTSESDGGLVVDDPVSSLDDERREHIAERLVAQASDRQVIVFTHDLPFMLHLVEKVEEAAVPVSVQNVWRLGGDIGRVDDHPPFKAMRLRDRVAALTQRVQEWDNQPEPRDFDEAWRRVRDFYADVRTTWERAVEERLFGGVVQRFQREVKTLKLRELAVTPERIAAIEAGMTRASEFVHDEPPAAGTALPGRTQLADDLQRLRDFDRETRR
jgi:energy-coupling factor transporter ATP-binding protein EcfA2